MCALDNFWTEKDAASRRAATHTMGSTSGFAGEMGTYVRRPIDLDDAGREYVPDEKPTAGEPPRDIQRGYGDQTVVDPLEYEDERGPQST